MGYNESQDFFVSHRRAIHLDRWESFAAGWLYLDNRGKKRAYKPNFGATDIKQQADELVDSGRTRLGYEQMYRTLERALENASTEIGERYTFRQEEIRRHVKLENSLAVSRLDISVLRLLVSAGFHTRKAIGQATDETLLSIRGIDKSRLTHIRKVCPKVRPEPALALQGSLF